MAGAFDRRWWRGVLLDEITIAALEWAETHSGVPVAVSQGSYNAGGVGASAGTHDGGGAADLKVLALSVEQRRKLVRYLRRAGFAAWYRGPIAGLWGPHIHAILLDHPHASKGAKGQMVAYRAGRNGLANNGPDVGWRPKVIPVFNWDAKAPLRPGQKPGSVLKATAPAAPLTVTEIRQAIKGGAPSTAVHSLQVALRRQGGAIRKAHPAPADGVYGDMTRAMVKAAQVKLDQKPTGVPSAALLVALGYARPASVASAKRKTARR